jgi:hypothetical protein
MECTDGTLNSERTELRKKPRGQRLLGRHSLFVSIRRPTDTIPSLTSSCSIVSREDGRVLDQEADNSLQTINDILR